MRAGSVGNAVGVVEEGAWCELFSFSRAFRARRWDVRDTMRSRVELLGFVKQKKCVIHAFHLRGTPSQSAARSC